MRKAELIRVAVPLAAIGLLTLAWQLPQSRQLLTSLPDLLEEVAELPGAPVLVMGVIVAAGFLAVPLTALVVATAAVLGPGQGLLVSWVGALISGTLVFAIGRAWGRSVFDRLLGERGRLIAERVADRGVVAVVVLRNVPVAPYSVVNLAAGASPIRLVDFVVGNGIGLLPGMAVLAVVGDRLAEVLRAPSLSNVMILAGAVVAAVIVGVVAGRVLQRKSDRDDR